MKSQQEPLIDRVLAFEVPTFFPPLSNAVWQTAGKWSVQYSTVQYVNSVKISSSNPADKFTIAKIKNSSNKQL